MSPVVQQQVVLFMSEKGEFTMYTCELVNVRELGKIIASLNTPGEQRREHFLRVCE